MGKQQKHCGKMPFFRLLIGIALINCIEIIQPEIELQRSPREFVEFREDERNLSSFAAEIYNAIHEKAYETEGMIMASKEEQNRIQERIMEMEEAILDLENDSDFKNENYDKLAELQNAIENL